MGDRNTQFFHGSTVIRRKKNRITRLLNEEGQWISNQEELESMITSFYEDSRRHYPSNGEKIEDRWIVGDGSNVNFWFDRWVPGLEPLI
uniref:Uncharacterized protein n=1 Tax=Cajanus cajan TaxID=3821 RepID=A0A151TT41_CAJCA|nr:hypothetical protein KK1_009382 [Cajanus cajan]